MKNWEQLRLAAGREEVENSGGTSALAVAEYVGSREQY